MVAIVGAVAKAIVMDKVVKTVTGEGKKPEGGGGEEGPGILGKLKEGVTKLNDSPIL